jgi:hypothetical protein
VPTINTPNNSSGKSPTFTALSSVLQCQIDGERSIIDTITLPTPRNRPD